MTIALTTEKQGTTTLGNLECMYGTKVDTEARGLFGKLDKNELWAPRKSPEHQRQINWHHKNLKQGTYHTK